MLLLSRLAARRPQPTGASAVTLPLAFGLFVVCGTAPAPSPAGAAPVVAPADTLLARLWSEGQEWPEFLDDTRRRRDTWHDNYERATVFADLAERVRAVPGTWRLLVVAVDSCGDSANTIPYLARFVEGVDGLEMRVVEPDVGQFVMDAHPTPDGRGATPTVVVMDAEGANRGCWVERPAGLQSWWIANPDDLSTRDKLERKYGWYDDDAGYHTILEIVESVEAAAGGGHLCGRPLEDGGPWPAAGPSGGR
ncbi:MAG: thioredoxin family protein [Longimicrobiales bacterium]